VNVINENKMIVDIPLCCRTTGVSSLLLLSISFYVIMAGVIRTDVIGKHHFLLSFYKPNKGNIYIFFFYIVIIKHNIGMLMPGAVMVV
jgi:hypothetical protein